ncbi:MAG: AraC family transcriptional regulator [Parvibaculum sp.]|uniref:AraC family transcriptional regulator n=1 Tax=Parvibaculum sp. TaxID=2024848 RepID=UPI0025CC92A1|nr:AraC family transcriptional regulator [Parvibaculum sp.]MCE9650347.1 AraC family transcriptional regulator [Parvibaculum sp.]
MKVQQAYIFALTRTIRELGFDLSPFVAQDSAMEDAEFYKLCEEAIALARDPTLALRFGAALHLGSHGLLGNALMSCRTLRQAAEFLVQHNPVRTAQGSIRFAFDQDNAVLSMMPGVELAGAPNFLVEAFFAAAVTAITELTGLELAGCRVEFSFRAPLPEEEYSRLLGMPVSFGKSANRLIGPRDAVDLPLVAAGNVVADMYVRQCGKLLRDQGRAENYAAEVRRVLLNARGEIASEYEVASRLHMSGRTLRRRLSCEGTSFREILDEARNEIARGYLRETRLSIAEVGGLLGFEDAANFRRAFRRWNGCSPQCFRETSVDSGFAPAPDTRETAFEMTSP